MIECSDKHLLMLSHQLTSTFEAKNDVEGRGFHCAGMPNAIPV